MKIMITKMNLKKNLLKKTILKMKSKIIKTNKMINKKIYYKMMNKIFLKIKKIKMMKKMNQFRLLNLENLKRIQSQKCLKIWIDQIIIILMASNLMLLKEIKKIKI